MHVNESSKSPSLATLHISDINVDLQENNVFAILESFVIKVRDSLKIKASNIELQAYRHDEKVKQVKFSGNLGCVIGSFVNNLKWNISLEYENEEGSFLSLWEYSSNGPSGSTQRTFKFSFPSFYKYRKFFIPRAKVIEYNYRSGEKSLEFFWKNGKESYLGDSSSDKHILLAKLVTNNVTRGAIDAKFEPLYLFEESDNNKLLAFDAPNIGVQFGKYIVSLNNISTEALFDPWPVLLRSSAEFHYEIDSDFPITFDSGYLFKVNHSHKNETNENINIVLKYNYIDEEEIHIDIGNFSMICDSPDLRYPRSFNYEAICDESKVRSVNISFDVQNDQNTKGMSLIGSQLLYENGEADLSNLTLKTTKYVKDDENEGILVTTCNYGKRGHNIRLRVWNNQTKDEYGDWKVESYVRAHLPWQVLSQVNTDLNVSLLLNNRDNITADLKLQNNDKRIISIYLANTETSNQGRSKDGYPLQRTISLSTYSALALTPQANIDIYTLENSKDLQARLSSPKRIIDVTCELGSEGRISNSTESHHLRLTMKRNDDPNCHVGEQRQKHLCQDYSLLGAYTQPHSAKTEPSALAFYRKQYGNGERTLSLNSIIATRSRGTFKTNVGSDRNIVTKELLRSLLINLQNKAANNASYNQLLHFEYSSPNGPQRKYKLDLDTRLPNNSYLARVTKTARSIRKGAHDLINLLREQTLSKLQLKLQLYKYPHLNQIYEIAQQIVRNYFPTSYLHMLKRTLLQTVWNKIFPDLGYIQDLSKSFNLHVDPDNNDLQLNIDLPSREKENELF